MFGKPYDEEEPKQGVVGTHVPVDSSGHVTFNENGACELTVVVGIEGYQQERWYQCLGEGFTWEHHPCPEGGVLVEHVLPGVYARQGRVPNIIVDGVGVGPRGEIAFFFLFFVLEGQTMGTSSIHGTLHPKKSAAFASSGTRISKTLFSKKI